MNEPATILAQHSLPGLLPRTQYRVPRGDLQFLLSPPLQETTVGIEQNRARLNASELLIWGKPLQAWRAAGRKECLEKAVCFTARTDFSPCTQVDPTLPLIATGHQPELYHPGVWIKNVLADALAKQTGGTALNITIDSDTIKNRAITVPARRHERLTQRRVVVDEWPLGMPWQEVRVQNRELFHSFASRVSQQLTPLQSPPVLGEYWEAVQKKLSEQSSLVNGLIAGRRSIEQQLGLHTLEVPISELCQTQVFREFVAGIMLDAASFQQIYNRALQQYRRTYQLKSSSHPMPDLGEREGWLELPFWIWTAQNWQRRSLYLKQTGNQLQLTDFADLHRACLLDSAQPREQLAACLGEWMREGLRLRTRALMTTLFLRLFVSDWFIHGIGGAKYDEITDALIQQYWQISPPEFQVATGTLWLPIQEAPASQGISSRELQLQLRAAEENPERLRQNSADPRWEQLLHRKHELIQQQQQRGRTGLTRRERRALHPQNRQRHQEFQQLRTAMAELVAPQLQQLRNQLQETLKHEQKIQVANHREYPFCCYPLSSLRTVVDKIRQSRLP